MPQKSPLFASSMGWSLSQLSDAFSGWEARNGDKLAISHLNAHGTFATINAFVANAIHCYVDAAAALARNVALVKVGKSHYSVEAALPGGDLVAVVTANGKCSAAIVEPSGRYAQLPQIGSKSDAFDLTPIFLMLLPVLTEVDAEASRAMEAISLEYQAAGTWNKNAVYQVCDAMYYAISRDVVKCNVLGGNFDLLSESRVATGALSGTVLCGKPTRLFGVAPRTKHDKSSVTMKEAKVEFVAWSSKQNWTEEERKLIPVFPDDFPVPPEAIKIARRFVSTRNDRRPMSNFMWRGITSYGKSTGVEVMAAFLDMPLLRITCHSTMETQNFLSDFVPDNGAANLTGDLPSFAEMAYDPESAYLALTGDEKESATSEDCLEAYAAAVSARSGSGVRFKHVESNYVKALSRGYIVEIQEVSRIKDSGVLVGLNEYDRPNAVIPLVNGGFVRRHPNAMALYTDNVGLVSCRPIDPSVIRRMAFIIDSYELPKKDAIARVMYNTSFPDANLLEDMYKVWCEISTFCKDREITDGSISVTELEMWAQAVQADGMQNVFENCVDCVVSKATNDAEEQQQIISSVLQIHLANYVTVA